MFAKASCNRGLAACNTLASKHKHNRASKPVSATDRDQNKPQQSHALRTRPIEGDAAALGVLGGSFNQKENVSPGARRVKQLGRGIRRLYDAYATTHAKKLFPDAAVDLFRDCGVVPAYASADDIKTVVGTEPIDYDGFCRAVAELGHVCFCRAVDVEGVGRVWTPAKDDDPLRALFRVISSSKAFYAAQKHTAALW